MNGARVDVGGIHQLHPRSSRLPRQHGSLCRRQGKAVPLAALRTAIINLDDEFGRKLLRETSAMRVLGYAIGESHRDFHALVVPRR
jgi:murE/murF fusion protein